jgi:hypothetical protein
LAFSIASASLKPGAAALRTGVLAGVVVSAVMTLPSQTSMLASCCPLYQIATIEDTCGKPEAGGTGYRGIEAGRLQLPSTSEYKSQQVASFSSKYATSQFPRKARCQLSRERQIRTATCSGCLSLLWVSPFPSRDKNGGRREC